jgi:hypothetical protein
VDFVRILCVDFVGFVRGGGQGAGRGGERGRGGE